MGEKIIKDAAEAIKACDKLLKDITSFVEKNIVKIDVKIKEGPLLKQARREVAKGLRNLATLVEDPTKKITWVDIKKPKSKCKK